MYTPFVKTYIKLANFELSRPSLSYRFSLFNQCFKQLFTLNFKFIEHVFSLIAPSGLVAFILSIFYLCLTFKYYFMFNFTVIFTVFSLLLLGFAISIIKSELFAKDFLYLILYPFYSIAHILDNLPPYRFIKKYCIKPKNKKNVQKFTVKVNSTDGKSNIPCKLDLISENGLARVVFSFKKKKFTTSSQIRMVEALNELITKLKDYGFVLKICYCCKYFEPNIDGSQNMIKGFCNFQFKGRTPGDELDTLIWNSCSVCSPHNKTNIIDDIRLNQGK